MNLEQKRNALDPAQFRREMYAEWAPACELCGYSHFVPGIELDVEVCTNPRCIRRDGFIPALSAKEKPHASKT